MRAALRQRAIPDPPFANWLRARLEQAHLESRHRAERRADALHRLAEDAPGTVSVLATARILTEGVDVPAVDTVIFGEPRTSAVDIVQAVGRAMRSAPGKTRGRVVLAVELPPSWMRTRHWPGRRGGTCGSRCGH